MDVMVGPTHTGFMDEDMRALWERLRPLPGDLRLYGGTALALYLDHRVSTDFDFATPLTVIDPDFVAGIPVVGEGIVRGGPGLVDVRVSGPNREVTVTFMECGHMVPMPVRDPVKASNGVVVAHPVDLTAAKLAACMNRGAVRDYEDVAACINTWSDWTRDAVGVLTAEGRVRDTEVRRVLADPPREVAGQLDAETRVRLRGFAQEFRMAQGKGGLHL